MIDEAEATGKTKLIYEDIRTTLDIDFVPNMYRAMAVKPDLLEANWNKVKTVMKGPGETGRPHPSAVRKLGLDDESIVELMAVVDLFSGFNKLMDGLQVEMDETPRCG
jgi:hypothetical protein